MTNKAKIEIFFLFVCLMITLFILFRELNKEESVVVPKDNKLELDYMAALRRIDSLEVEVDQNANTFRELIKEIDFQKNKNKQIKTRHDEKINSVDTLNGDELYKLFTTLGRKKRFH